MNDDSLLRVYLLGPIEFAAVQTLQRALLYTVTGNRRSGALILCEHPPLVTVGRHGRPNQMHLDTATPGSRPWPVRWVNRGGGCWLHLPGQLAIYPILPLDFFHLGVEAYRERFQQILIDLLDDFGVCGKMRLGHEGVWVGPRPIAHLGLAIREWVVYFGAVFNLNPDLVPYREMVSDQQEPMTSLERERRGPLRPGLVRERLLGHFQEAFPFDRTVLFTGHPLLGQRAEQLAWA
jgi:lipoyl(octanoyl) transferase